MVLDWICGLGDDPVPPAVVLGVMIGVVEFFNSDVGVLEEAVVEGVAEGVTPIVVRIEAFLLKCRTPTPLLQSQNPDPSVQQ